MLITKIEEVFLPELSSYNTADIYTIEGIEAPVWLRQATLDLFIAKEVFVHEAYDVSMSKSRHYQDYKEEFGVREPKYIIDAGGNIGMTSIYYANKFPDAKIITVEPDDDNFKLLKRNTAPYPNVRPIKGAVWDKNTGLYISNREDTVRPNGVKNAGKYIVDEQAVPGEKAVDAFTIDRIIEDHGIDMVDILKFDIEGAEREIFAGNHEKWLPKVRIMIIEHHDFYKPGSTRSIFKALSDYDFHFMYDHAESAENLMFLFEHGKG